MSSDPNPPPVRPWIPPADDDQGGYNMNTSILATGLISLTLVVAVLLFLHLYIRFVLRRRLPDDRGRRLASVDFLRIHAAAISVEEPRNPAGVGLDSSAIAALPCTPYRKDAAGNGAECAVCLSAVEEGELVRLLPACKHLFHMGCIDMWLASHTTCPVCRAMVEPPAAAAADEVAADNETSAAASQARESSGEGTSSGPKDGGSVSRRLSASFRRILSGRDRSLSSSSSRRGRGESTDDLERQ